MYAVKGIITGNSAYRPSRKGCEVNTSQTSPPGTLIVKHHPFKSSPAGSMGDDKRDDTDQETAATKLVTTQLLSSTASSLSSSKSSLVPTKPAETKTPALDSVSLTSGAVRTDEDRISAVSSAPTTSKDVVRDILEKDPKERTDDDIDLLVDFMQTLPVCEHTCTPPTSAMIMKMSQIEIRLAETRRNRTLSIHIPPSSQHR